METENIIRMYENVLKMKHKYIYSLKSEQVAVMRAVLTKHDCFGLLPTGFGKIICATVFCHFYLALLNLPRGISLVISPLASLIADQCQHLGEHGIECASFSHELKGGESLEKASVIFASPEAIMSRSLWLDEPYRDQLCLIACDEAYCVSEWGEHFRPEFREISVLRSFTDCLWIALTATATSKVKDDIFKCLLFDPSRTITIAVLPDRPNIFLDITEASAYCEKELKWFLHHMKETRLSAKKTIIYCSQNRRCGSESDEHGLIPAVRGNISYEKNRYHYYYYLRTYSAVCNVWFWLVEEMGDVVYSGEKSAKTRLIEMYHSSTDKETQERVIKEFRRPESIIRCLVATVAFGMVIQIGDVDIVIHWGCPKSILSYWQEIGRCARDGIKGYACLLPYRTSMMKTTTDANMTEVAKDRQVCLRRKVLDALWIPEMEKLPAELKGCSMGSCNICSCDKCNCCVNCRNTCQCSGHKGRRKYCF